MANNPELTMLFDFYGDILTDKQRDMIDFYYNEDLSLAEIAENEGITRQGVRDCIKRAESQLFEIEDNLGLCKKFHNIKKKLAIIQSHVDDIDNINLKASASFDISKRCREISDILRELSE